MKIQRKKFPDLNDLAFSGRNRDYGSFILRKKYPRSLLISFILSIVSLLLMTLIPFFVYYFRGPDLDLSADELFSVEYTFIPSPDDDLSSLAKSLARPQAPPEEEVPEVVDSTPPVQKAPEEVKQVENTDIKTDSSGTSKGNSSEGTGSSDATGIYTTLDVYPRFPGGTQAFLNFLRTNIRYPSTSLKSGIQGEVMVLFMVEADGLITNVSVNKGIGKECDEEAARVIKSMPRWEPGRRYGKCVRVLVRMPIVFRIPGRK
ncbi:MAG: energy transducer TonB [Bacteroidales bacterium]|jgi:protein TonB